PGYNGAHAAWSERMEGGMGAIPATGADLVRQIASTNPARGSLALWWFGQAGFALRGAGLTALVDPFLGPHEARLISPAVDPREFSGVDVICCTHEHLDHLDGATVAGLLVPRQRRASSFPVPLSLWSPRSGSARSG